MQYVPTVTECQSTEQLVAEKRRKHTVSIGSGSMYSDRPANHKRVINGTHRKDLTTSKSISPFRLSKYFFKS